MFTEKDKFHAESLVLLHPWMSDDDFFDFIGNGGTYFKLAEKKPVLETKKIFFCKLDLVDGKLILFCRFIGENNDEEELEIINYSPNKFTVKSKTRTTEWIYNKVEGSVSHLYT